jgi:hypothetical protein
MESELCAGSFTLPAFLLAGISRHNDLPLAAKQSAVRYPKNFGA